MRPIEALMHGETVKVESLVQEILAVGKLPVELRDWISILLKRLCGSGVELASLGSQLQYAATCQLDNPSFFVMDKLVKAAKDAKVLLPTTPAIPDPHNWERFIYKPEPLTELKISPEPPEKFQPQDVTDQELRELRHLFTYHPPQYGQPAKYEHLRGLAHTLAREYMLLIPAGPEREEAIKAVRSSVNWANAGISCREVIASPFQEQ